MGQQPKPPQIGDDVTALMPAVGEDVTALMSSHGIEENAQRAASQATGLDNGRPQPISTGGGRGTGFNFGQQRRVGDMMKRNAPGIAAAAVTAAVPEIGA